ncbi:MAG: recombinase family protein [Oscillospiraceae bacterium]
MKIKKAVIYCRVDNGGNHEVCQLALDAQRHHLERYAAQKGIQVVGRYEDAGFSGRDMNRHSLMQMMNDYEKGIFDTVLVVNRCRLYRGNLKDEPKWAFQVVSLNQLEQDLAR